jgi:hypothetical protein
VGRIFCDLTIAFDCLNNDILLSKLNFCGITGIVSEWIKSYRRNRYQRVEIKNNHFNHNTFASWGGIKHSVPHGSVLDPLLFFLYINDLSKTINGKSKPIVFADNMSIMYTNSNLEDFENGVKI